MRDGFPMGYADLDYQSKLRLGQTDVMPDTSAELVCFAQAPDLTWHALNSLLNLRVQYNHYDLILTALFSTYDATLGYYFQLTQTGSQGTRWHVARCTAPKCAASVICLCFPSMREGREAVGALHYQSEQSFPAGLLLTELGSVSAPKLMF